jgi:hypothetical protein
MTERRRPYHLGVFLGLSAGAYAACLAGVTALQADADAQLAAARQPGFAAAARLSIANDELAARLDAVATAYSEAAQHYDRVGAGLSDFEAELQRLAAIVSSVQGAAQALPNRVALPSVSRTITRTVVSAPTTHATTGASGK